MAHADYRVYVSPRGNIFMTEIAEALADAVIQSGRTAELRQSGLPAREPGLINLVVAPHEYFTLYEGASEAAIAWAASESVTVGVEQPGTNWFEYGTRYACLGPMAIDINRRGVMELRRRGIEAYRLQPGYYSGWDAWGGDPFSKRSTDVLFLGSLTPRRERFLAESAPILSQWEIDLRLFLGDRPVQQGSSHFVTGPAKHELLADSRVLLNVHQGDRDYFEWIRVLEAINNGCLVMTETSGGYAPLLPSRHFVQGALTTLAGQVDAMLRDEDLRSQLAADAYALIRSQLDFVVSVDRLLDLVERRCASDTDRTRAPRLAPSFRKAGRRAPAPPMAVPAAEAKPLVNSVFDEAVTHEGFHKAAVKNLVLSELADSRVLEATIAALEHGSQDHALITDTAGYRGATPEVSVVLTHYNYGEFVGDAIASVVASTGVEVELVIVDNHSDAVQLESLRSNIARFEWFPIRLVANSADRGPSGSRNIGARHARAELILLLDADNMLYPNGARVLAEVLKDSDAAFAYGIIEKFGGEPGLLSAIDWDIDRLVQANYIDTMALIRKKVWDEFGGFDPQVDAIGGYDDYAFWLQLAAAGYRGQSVSSFIGRYRVHGKSWQSVLNLDTSEFMQFYRDRHPTLPWPTLERS